MGNILGYDEIFSALSTDYMYIVRGTGTDADKRISIINLFKEFVAANATSLITGIPLWDATITYNIDTSFVQDDGNIYVSLIGSNLNNEPSANPSSWEIVVGKEITCKAWVNFNGTGVVAIRDSFNISSITDNGLGDWTANFINNMADINYAVTYGGPGVNFGGPNNTAGVVGGDITDNAVGSFKIMAYHSEVGPGDVNHMSAIVFGS